MASKYQPKSKDDPNKEDNLKNEGNLKKKDFPKIEDGQKNGGQQFCKFFCIEIYLNICSKIDQLGQVS